MAKQTYTWVDAIGREYPLTGGTAFEILAGTKGFYMPPIELAEEEIPYQAGSRIRQVNVKTREVEVPLKIFGKTPVELEQNLRLLLRIINPLKGDGKLKVAGVDGEVRILHCRYIGGFEIDENVSTRGKNWQLAIGVFKATDPYWYSEASMTREFKLNENTATFFPFFPLRLSSSTVFADINVANDGDIETWPEWIIQGPGEDIALKNMTTGESLTLKIKLEAWESVSINTKPFEKTVLKNDGTNLYYALAEDSSLWALSAGNNSIQIEMSDATEDSKVQVSFSNKYWGV